MPDKPPVALDATRYISLEDNVALPLLYIAYPTVYLYHEDEAPLDVLMYILGQGETSLLYKNMVKNQIAVQAQAGHGCRELSCLFTVVALPNPAAGKTLADLERIVHESLGRVRRAGHHRRRLAAHKDGHRLGNDLQPRKRRGQGQPTRGVPVPDRHTGFRAARRRPLRECDQGRRDARLRALHQGQARGGHEHRAAWPGAVARPRGTWERYERELPDYEKVAAEELAYRRAEDDFDRSVIPPAGANPAITLPDIWRGELDNGIAVLGARNAETPTTSIRLRIAAGQRHESLEQLGLAALTANMMNEATEQSSNEELSDRLQKLGSSVSFQAGNDETVATVRSLTRNLDETLAILAENCCSRNWLPRTSRASRPRRCRPSSRARSKRPARPRWCTSRSSWVATTRLPTWTSAPRQPSPR